MYSAERQEVEKEENTLKLQV